MGKKKEKMLREAQGDLCDVAPSRSIQMSAERTDFFFFLFGNKRGNIINQQCTRLSIGGRSGAHVRTASGEGEREKKQNY